MSDKTALMAGRDCVHVDPTDEFAGVSVTFHSGVTFPLSCTKLAFVVPWIYAYPSKKEAPLSFFTKLPTAHALFFTVKN